MLLNTNRVDFHTNSSIASQKYRASPQDITTNAERIFVPLEDGAVVLGKDALADIIEATPTEWMPDE